ncbi:hypothetical protein FALBO_10660 [Fusarium albosuccineum]|uniref:Uncharacterized protein n=1 Tax=Fusarium albosuccineum TaxID=1237068 RepID=A0A8H4L3Z9_9HYPO|nr:hypothetical protein FALBO_10660 [Fusarium albosuccineum]
MASLPPDLQSRPDIKATDDIRTHYSITDDAAAVSWILTMRPPTTPCADICPVTTGMDCLLVVLGHIYSLAMTGKDGLAHQDWFKEAESRNAILRFAWRVFGDFGLEHEDASKDKAKFLDQISFSKDSFLSICSSDFMNTTFWSQTPFLLFQTKFSLSQEPDARPPQEMSPATSIIDLNLRVLPDATLQQAVDRVAGFRIENAVYTTSTPHIIRVQYTPGVTRLNFQALRQFYLFPVEISAGQGGDKGRSLHTRQVRYALVAVVRLRFHREEEDSVRTYDPCGFGIFPDCEPLDFMLFFSRADDKQLDPEWPELSGPPPRLDPGLEQLLEDTLSDAAGLPRTQIPDKRTMFPVSPAPPAGP